MWSECGGPGFAIITAFIIQPLAANVTLSLVHAGTWVTYGWLLPYSDQRAI